MYHFIVNPNSRGGLGSKLWEKLKIILDEKKIIYNYSLTKNSKDAEKIATSLSENINNPTTIIVLGGDGTLNEVVNGLKNINLITLGVVPIGSGNDFVRSFGDKKTYQQYLESILSPKEIVEYNMGIVENENYTRKFIVSSGIGFDASITNTVNYSIFRKIFKNTPIVKLIYIFSTIKILIQYKSLKYTVHEDNKVTEFDNGFFCVVMNTPYEGKAVKFCPNAKGYDNYLDFCIITSKHKLKIVYLILRAYFGKHITSKSVYISKGKNFKIECSDITHCHTDGEQIGKSNWAKYYLANNKLKIIVN
ncbi:diacylglycerol/lipid kinase family protein [Miniphocaeibacter massiliensis]|uniref:diacylglycerol/lipid kinase family protein n=1 Tax=Miniphocaeibacter massiliensis TaxID=2041841 RepID=UPI000C1B993D|nr:YegS/Rv2252/BmrU family lipid kinase [Miniphocaeibacter massiliensis]